MAHFPLRRPCSHLHLVLSLAIMVFCMHLNIQMSDRHAPQIEKANIKRKAEQTTYILDKKWNSMKTTSDFATFLFILQAICYS